MVRVWDDEFAGNPANTRFIDMAHCLGIDDWRKCKEMYQNLHPEVRKELDNYLSKVIHMEIWEGIRNTRELMKRQSTILPITRGDKYGSAA